MEPGDVFVTRDPYRFRVRVGDLVRLTDRRLAVVAEVGKLGGFMPTARIHIIVASWQERLIRRLAGTNLYLDTQIDELTLVA